jgi:hypothetical protein
MKSEGGLLVSAPVISPAACKAARAASSQMARICEKIVVQA